MRGASKPPNRTQRKRASPLGGALAGEKEYSHNMSIMDNKHKPKRVAMQLHVIARKLEIGHCHDCSIKVTPHNFVVFQFDNIDRTTKVEKISKMVAGKYTINDIDTEIAKCQMVCANCHAMRTYYRRDHDQLSQPKAQQPRLFNE